MLKDTVCSKFLVPAWKNISNFNYSRIIKYKIFLENTQTLPYSDIRAIQLSNLKNLLIYAYENVDYYNFLFKSHDINPYNTDILSEFKRIPLLNRSNLQSTDFSFMSRGYNFNNLKPMFSGGTSGEPLKFFRDFSSEFKIDASNWRFYDFSGYKPGQKIFRLWGNLNDINNAFSLKGRVRSFIYNEKLLNCFILNDETIYKYIKLINKHKPKAIRSYSTFIFKLVDYAQNNNLHLHKPKTIIITADSISTTERKIINNYFNNNVFSEYGSREFSILGFECKEHNGLHLSTINNYLEIDNLNGTKFGEVIVTSLTNYAMPIIRYKIGDYSSFLNTTCKCGINLPLFESIAGRVSSFLKTKSGNLVHPNVFNRIFYNSINIKQYQVIQNTFGSFTINIVRSDNFSDDSLKIISSLKEVFKKDMDFDLNYLDKIEMPISGKYMSVISSVD